jgi:PST family polysaccharide transporter
VGTIVNFFNLVGDVGLGAALIQQADEPSERQLRSVFTGQQIVACLVVLAVFAVSPLIARQYHLSMGSLWLVRVVSFSLFLASLRSVPGMLLERSMQFGKIAVIDSVQALGYTVIAIVLALSGFRVWSLVLASLISSLVGLALAYRFMPWRPTVRLDWPVIKRLVRFGLSFQGISIVSLVKDSINPLLIGYVAGIASVGYVNWANQVASYPVIAVWVINKVTFPLFARLQNDAVEFGENLELFMRLNAVASYGLAAPIVALAPSITMLIFGAKWLPGVPLLYLFSFAVLWIAPGLPVGNAMSAIGRSGTMLRLSLLWAALTWVLGVPLILQFGFIGFGFAHVAIQFTNILVYRKLRRVYAYRIWSNVWAPLVALMTAGGAGFALARLYPPATVLSLIVMCVLTAAIYLATVWLLWKQTLLADIGTIRAALLQSVLRSSHCGTGR